MQIYIFMNTTEKRRNKTKQNGEMFVLINAFTHIFAHYARPA